MRMNCWLASVTLFISACSPLPLPEDTTGLTTYDIVQKIRCETRTAVDAILAHAPFAHQRATYKRDAENLKAKRDDQIAIDEQGVVLKKKRAELVARRDSLKERERDIIRRMQEANSPNVSEATKEQFRQELAALRRQQDLWEQDKRAFQKITARHNIEAAKAAAEAARRERNFKDTYKHLTDFYRHQVAYLFRFQITETNKATAGGTFSMPIHLGSLKIGFGAGADRERYRERQVKVAGSFEDLLDARCGDEPPTDRHVRRRYPITGEIGVAETLRQFLLVAKAVKFKTEGESYIDELQFTTTIDAKLLPEITLTPVSKRTLSLDVDLTGSRKDLHEVMIYLAPPPASKPPAEDKVVQVRLVKDPPADELGLE